MSKPIERRRWRQHWNWEVDRGGHVPITLRAALDNSDEDAFANVRVLLSQLASPSQLPVPKQREIFLHAQKTHHHRGMTNTRLLNLALVISITLATLITKKRGKSSCTSAADCCIKQILNQ